MTTYGDALADAQLGRMEDAIASFLQTYNAHKGDPKQRTIIFFPGGMGSSLVRATTAFNPTLPGSSYTYQTVWIDLEKILVEEWALLLQMDDEKDSGERFMVPHGAIDNCAIHPYAGFISWCTAQKLDLLMVGWDWRRNRADNVGFFFQTLVPELKRRAGPDVFKGATLLGHSFGGMLVKWILNEPDPLCQDLRLAITVGSPFYGSPGQNELLFKSEPLLGPLYDPDDVTKCISTLKGGYSLFFLDSKTWADYGPLLAQDPAFPINTYPSLDHDDNVTPVDPYQWPAYNKVHGNLCRYPIDSPRRNYRWTWFDSYIKDGLADYQAVAKPLEDANIRAKFHNIRGVQTNVQNADVSETKVSQTWGWYDLTQNRMPQAKSVIQTKGGPGDGVIPAWSARLVTQDVANVHTIRGNKDGTFAQPPFDHMVLMNHPAIQARLLDLILPATSLVVLPYVGPRPASVAEFDAARAQVEALAREHRVKAFTKDAIKAYIDSLSPEQQQALALRWYIELPKGHPPAS